MAGTAKRKKSGKAAAIEILRRSGKANQALRLRARRLLPALPQGRGPLARLRAVGDHEGELERPIESVLWRAPISWRTERGGCPSP